MTDSSWQAASKIIEALEEQQFEAVIVGGAVRDFLLGKEANDVDVATSALPEETKAVFTKTFDVGIEHGTVLVVDFKEPVEVTTFRTDGDYTDHRRPDEVIFVRSLEEDLKRRDFTINAMAMRPNGDIIDLFNGRSDLVKRIIRAVGNAHERFSEDALRILRALRFSAQLDFRIEEKTQQAMYDSAAFLEKIARERMKIEFDKIFKSTYPSNAISAINDTPIATYLHGEFMELALWKKLQTAGNEIIGWTFWVYTTGNRQLLDDYRCSNEEKKQVAQALICMEILQQGDPSKMALFLYDESIWQVASACSNAVTPQQKPQLFENIRAQKKALPIQSRQELAISGRDLMAWTGKKGGPWLKEALESIIVNVVMGRLQNDEQQIKDWFKHEWNNQA